MPFIRHTSFSQHGTGSILPAQRTLQFLAAALLLCGPWGMLNASLDPLADVWTASERDQLRANSDGRDLRQTLSPEADLAARISAGEHERVEAELNEIIAHIERTDGRYAAALARPLLLLGEVYDKQQRISEAIDTYQRSVHVARVSDGLNSVRQVEALYKQADLLARTGDLGGAQDREENAYEVLAKNTAATNVALLPGTIRLAHWYSQVGWSVSARRMYLRALKIFYANGVDNTPQAIPVLRALANSYKRTHFPSRYVRTARSTGRRSILAKAGGQFRHPTVPLPNNRNFTQGELALRQVIGILRDQQPQDPQSLAAAVTDLADWMLLFDKTAAAEALYRDAFSILERGGIDAASVFARPKLLHFPAPSDPQLAPWYQTGEPVDGHVTVNFNVSDTGKVRRIKTLESNPSGLIDHSVRRALRMARFRPTLNAQGEVAAFESFDFIHRFKYHPGLDR